jgi:hypothetical protein
MHPRFKKIPTSVLLRPHYDRRTGMKKRRERKGRQKREGTRKGKEDKNWKVDVKMKRKS